MLNDAQSTNIKMQRLLIDKERERQQNILNFTSSIKTGLDVYRNIQETKEAKENAEVNRALNIANSYMSSKIQTDLKTKANYGEQSYRDEISNFNIFDIQTIQELNLSDGAKEKLLSNWQNNKVNLLASYEATLPGYQMTGLMNEIEKEASTIYNNDINTNIFEGLKQYKDYCNEINPNKILIKGKTNLLLEDDHNSNIVGGILANKYNEIRHSLDFNADTSFKNLLEEEEAECLANISERKDDNDIYATEYKILKEIKNDQTRQNEILKIADSREAEKNKYIQNNVSETCTTFQNNLTQMLQDYKIQNNKNYVLDTRTDANGNFANDSLGILNSTAKQLDTIETLNISPSLKQAQKGQILQTTRDVLGDNLINGLFTCDNYEEAYSSIGLLDTDNKLIKELFSNTDIQERAKNLLDFAKENKIDISTEQGKNILKNVYKEYGTYTDTNIRRVKKIRDAYDILDDDKFITYLRNQGLDANTQEALLKEYKATQSKYSKQIKNYYDSFIKETTEKLFQDEDKREIYNLENKSDKLPVAIQNKLETSFYTYLIEHGDDINYTDEKELNNLSNQLVKDLGSYLDSDAEIFATIDSDLKDLSIDDPESLKFIYKSQQNLIFSNGFNKVFDYLSNGYSSLSYKDIENNQDKFLEQIATKYYNAKDFESLNSIQKIEAKGGLAYYRVLRSQQTQIENGFDNFEKLPYQNKNRFSIERVEFDENRNPRYIIRDNSTDKENENIRNNVALVLTPSSLLNPSDSQKMKWMVDNPNYDPNMPDENVAIFNKKTTNPYKEKSSTITFDNYIISCAMKDSNGNILWDTINDENFTKNNYRILKLARNYNENNDNYELTKIIVNQRDLLNEQIKEYASKHNIF